MKKIVNIQIPLSSNIMQNMDSPIFLLFPKDFYSEIKRKELYLRYVYKLSKLHLDCDNYTEAGYTLKLHTDLLRWTTESLSTALRSPLYPDITQHGLLKELLYSQIIDHFDKGKVGFIDCMYG